jgi:hypothetical protein
MREIVSACLWARQFDYDPEQVAERYAIQGYAPGPALDEFIRDFVDMRFIWAGSSTGKSS